MSVKETQKKYNASNIKRIPLDIQKKYYTEVLKPAAESAGEPVNTYIKNAVLCRIRGEGNESGIDEIPPEVIVNLIKWLKKKGHTDSDILDCLKSFADPIEEM